MMNVADCLGDESREWLADLVLDIITKKHFTIAIFCRAGMHRSMSLAELLRKRVFLKAQVMHLSAWRHRLS